MKCPNVECGTITIRPYRVMKPNLIIAEKSFCPRCGTVVEIPHKRQRGEVVPTRKARGMGQDDR